DHLTSFFTGIISIVGSVIILLILDWKMTLIMLIAVLLTLSILFQFAAKWIKSQKGLKVETPKLIPLIVKVLSRFRLVNYQMRKHQNTEMGKKAFILYLNMVYVKGKFKL